MKAYKFFDGSTDRALRVVQTREARIGTKQHRANLEELAIQAQVSKGQKFPSKSNKKII